MAHVKTRENSLTKRVKIKIYVSLRWWQSMEVERDVTTLPVVRKQRRFRCQFSDSTHQSAAGRHPKIYAATQLSAPPAFAHRASRTSAPRQATRSDRDRQNLSRVVW